MISSHTLELAIEMDREAFEKLKGEARNRDNYDRATEKDYALIKNGITVWYHRTEFKRKIKLLVNPNRMLGYNDLVKLWKPSRKNISKLLNGLEESIDKYFGSRYRLNDFTLTRIDFTKNLHLAENSRVSAYIKVLNNIKKVKGFSPKYGKGDRWYDYDAGFDLEGNSNGVVFTAYDKEAAIKSEEKESEMEYRKKERKARLASAEGLLRIEVKLTTQKAIRQYTDKNNAAMRIADLSEKSEQIFFDTFRKVVPFGDFYKKDKATEIIQENILNKTTRRKMLELVDLIPKKKSLHLAQKEMGDRNMERIMETFARLNLSPVSISKRQEVRYLPNMYSLI